MSAIATAILAVLAALPPHVRPCGPETGEQCGEYAERLSGALERVETATGVPAELLLGIALVETGGTLRRDRHAPKGRGLWGLNPRSPHYAYAVIGCDLAPSTCLETQAAMAAGYLQYERQRCGGWRGALHSYATGRCHGGRPGERYARMVRARVRSIRERGGL